MVLSHFRPEVVVHIYLFSEKKLPPVILILWKYDYDICQVKLGWSVTIDFEKLLAYGGFSLRPWMFIPAVLEALLVSQQMKGMSITARVKWTENVGNYADDSFTTYEFFMVMEQVISSSTQFNECYLDNERSYIWEENLERTLSRNW